METMKLFLGALLLLAFISVASAHEVHMFQALNSYGWGNSPEWLQVVCSNGRTDCWT